MKRPFLPAIATLVLVSLACNLATSALQTGEPTPTSLPTAVKTKPPTTEPTPAPTPTLELTATTVEGAMNISSEDCQATIAAMAALTSGLEIPWELGGEQEPVRTGEEFDPNQYFTVLKHLSMQPGYTLDYVYYDGGIGAEPVLYSRPADQPPYRTFSEFQQAQGESTPEKSRHVFMEDVQADGSPQGFFEYAVMDVMASQFYLSWHAFYNDFQIICGSQGFDTIQADLNGFGLELPADIASQAQALDFTTLIEFKDSNVKVQVIVFTKWGGFQRWTYTMKKDFPHAVQLEAETLVEYNCGIMF